MAGLSEVHAILTAAQRSPDWPTFVAAGGGKLYRAAYLGARTAADIPPAILALAGVPQPLSGPTAPVGPLRPADGEILGPEPGRLLRGPTGGLGAMREHLKGQHDQADHGRRGGLLRGDDPLGYDHPIGLGIAGMRPEAIRQMEEDATALLAPPAGPGYPGIDKMAEALLVTAERAMKPPPEGVGLNDADFAAARDWYFLAHDRMVDLAEVEFGGQVSPAQLAAATAAMSPQNDWADGPRNPKTGKRFPGNESQTRWLARALRDDETIEISQAHLDYMAEHGVETGLKIGDRRKLSEMSAEEVVCVRPPFPPKVMTGPAAKAVRILRGEDDGDVLKGGKVRSFGLNLADPANSQHFTVDVWAIRGFYDNPEMSKAQVGAVQAAFEDRPGTTVRIGGKVLNPKTGKYSYPERENGIRQPAGIYPLYAEAGRRAFEEFQRRHPELDFTHPHQLQALAWVVAKKQGETEGGQSKAGLTARKKTLAKKKGRQP